MLGKKQEYTVQESMLGYKNIATNVFRYVHMHVCVILQITISYTHKSIY